MGFHLEELVTADESKGSFMGRVAFLPRCYTKGTSVDVSMKDATP